MLSTLKAELAYNTTVVAIFGILVIASVWGAIALERGNVYAVITNTSMIMIFAHVVINKKRKKELFVRRAAILPQSLSTASWSRFLAIGVLQAIVLAVWLLMYLAFHLRDDASAIWKLLSSNALLMTVLVLMTANKDNCAWRDPGRLIVNIVAGLAAGFALVMSFANMGSYVLFHMDTDSPRAMAYTEFLKSPAGAIIANAVFVIALVVVHHVYQRRQSFLK